MSVIKINSDYEEIPESEDGKVIIDPYIEKKCEIEDGKYTEKRLERWQDKEQENVDGSDELPPFYPIDKDRISRIIDETIK